MKKTVAVGLSGGVDSTLAALLLKEQGYNVIGLTMSIYNKDIPNLKASGNSCYGPTEKTDLQDVKKWGAANGIEVHILDCSEEYKTSVLHYFKKAYLDGITPNPCVFCNETMKFGLLCDKAKNMGINFDYFATGHYARILRADCSASADNPKYILQKGIDANKDQSYFLYRLSQTQLAQTLFPLGEYSKDQVRHMAKERGLAVADKADSQDFYAGDYADLLEQPPQKGDIVHVNGRVLGTHEGYWNYTIGQRKGLGVAYPVPLFVVALDSLQNQVIVGEVEATYSRTCPATDVVWGGLIKQLDCADPIAVLAKYRSAGKEVPAILEKQGDDMIVTFDEPQRALTPGQSIVCYNENGCVLCGGIIKKQD